MSTRKVVLAVLVASALALALSAGLQVAGTVHALPPNVDAPAPQATWHIEHVDTAREFSDMGNRSLALDASGNPHIAYGSNRLYHRWWDGAAWQVETVDNTPGVGSHTSIAVESAGQIHISYYDGVNGDLRYAYWALGTTQWFTFTVAGYGDVGLYSSLDVDSTGAAHIAYYDATNHALKYVYDTGYFWDDETVDSGHPVVGLALDLDAAGRPHIAYVEYRGTYDELRYAYFDGTNWQIITIDTGEQITRPSLALDAAGHPHISYGKRFGGTVSLRHAYSDGAVWHHEIVDDVNGNTGYDSSIVLDAAGNPHISYYDAGSKALCYTYYDPGSDWWETTWVDDSANVGKFSSLALGWNGTPYISYYDETNEDLKYAFYTCPIGGCFWFVQELDHSGYVGTYSSLALLNGQPRIAYYDEANRDLKYAYKDGTWHTLAVDLLGGVGKYASLALDSDGDARISYSDCTNGSLKYADEDGGYWWTEPVDSGSLMFATSIAVDTNDLPHISYVDWGHDGLKYASLVGTGNGNCGPGNSWYCEVVAGASDAGLEVTSLALDSAGRPHIAYVDDIADALKYAHYDGTSWQISVIDTLGSFDGYPSLALYWPDRPHVTYCVRTDPPTYTCNELRYAYLDGTTWVTETVDSGGKLGRYSSLAFDATGHQHVSYFDETNGDLKCAYRVSLPGGLHFWLTETVDSYGVVGKYSSLEIAPDGSLHISYFCSTAGDLCYAHTEVAPPPMYRVYLPMLSRY